MPTPIVFDTPELQNDETLKTFDSTDALGTSYRDMSNRVKSGSIDLLPEEMRKDPSIAAFKTLPELAKGYVETKKLVGGIDRAPEKPEGYTFTGMQGLHEKVKAEAVQAELRAIAHKAGLGVKGADAMQQGVLTLLSNRMAQQDAARKDLALKNETELRNEWGANYDAKFDKVLKVMTAAGGKDAMADVAGITSVMRGSPGFVKMMDKLVGMLSEDSIMSLGDGGDKEITDATGARAEIDKYNAEILALGNKHPYWDEKSPDHAKAHEKMKKLFELANKPA